MEKRRGFIGSHGWDWVLTRVMALCFLDGLALGINTRESFDLCRVLLRKR